MEIRRLPENLINQIAAGEVVERPASALKELIENSIDANATQIDIVLDDGGKSLISVSDNGIGIEKNHIGLAVERHATSKLPTNNLNKINFLGFRGEALPSIAAVSQLNIQTKSKNSNDAWALDVAAGNFDEIYPSSRQIGTIISVKNLFYATPARLKFLKSSNLERSYCHQIVLKQALVNPLIGFRLQSDGRELLNIKPENERDADKSFLNRIRNILGKNFADEAIKIYENLKRMEDVGVVAVEAECIAEEVLEAVNKKTSIVTFSLGSGMAGDLIMSFVADICGEESEEEKPPKHAYAFGNVGRLHKQIHEERVAALGKFHSEVTKGNFPYPQTNISMHDGEKDKFLEALDKWSPTHQ